MPSRREGLGGWIWSSGYGLCRLGPAGEARFGFCDTLFILRLCILSTGVVTGCVRLESDLCLWTVSLVSVSLPCLLANLDAYPLCSFSFLLACLLPCLLQAFSCC